MTHALSAAPALTGVWNGRYSYDGPYAPGDFVAVLFETGGHVGGTTHEPDWTGATADRLLYATVEGARQGADVRFVKTYDGSGGQTHTVRYTGVLSACGAEIEGAWSIPGACSGRFLMIRPAGPAMAVEREAVEVVR
ncbi:hypothetical protein [Caulobacter sp. 17J80-11]|uniref:hypothetical protein n=1 Tax=Caulobacter sp. 17J80-11 TaxID=2763502 RepID=UPI0016537D45|nr:hypothetical protein [Caulobacter sp. 17J80-11]MBC6982129.1 hypothetical protein [Caulobacter sp. 17J80-11]